MAPEGLGEGDAIGPPSAIANAINDALKDLNVTVDRLSMFLARLFELIRAAGPKSNAI